MVLTVPMADEAAQDIKMATISVSPNGGVIADRIGGKPLVLRLAPLSADEEGIYRLIERVAKRGARSTSSVLDHLII